MQIPGEKLSVNIGMYFCINFVNPNPKQRTYSNTNMECNTYNWDMIANHKAVFCL